MRNVLRMTASRHDLIILVDEFDARESQSLADCIVGQLELASLCFRSLTLIANHLST
jgi:hypothetical protein